jgi:arylsulfatase A-like enzyme
VTTIDAALLQRRRGLFTGGFLSDDHLSGVAETLAFVTVSLLIDAAVGGLLAVLAMYPLARAGASRLVVMTAGSMAAIGPLMLANAVNYEIARYLGPAFDLGLLFDLTGRSVAEFLAVASAQLWAALLTLAGLLVVACATLWAVGRVGGVRAPMVRPRALLVPILLIAISAIVLSVAVSARESLSNGLLRKPSGQALERVITLASDVDRDGFGSIGRLVDPQPFDRRVFPYAVDVPDNGVDENGVAGDLPGSAPTYLERPCVEGGFVRTPDVLLVVLESFRADLIGSELGGKPITPILNALAARGLAAPRAYSHNGYTVQSRFHLLAGTLTAREDAPTLIDDFRANGYVTASFSGQDEAFGGSAYGVGFERADVAFDARGAIEKRYTTFATPGSLAVAHDVVQDEIDDFLKARAADSRPLFMYVGFGDTHFPYAHGGIKTLVSDARLARGDIAPDRREELWATYANTAANIDQAVGVLIERVRRARGREPVIIITADHGESLFDEGFLGHGHELNDVQTRIPFIVVNLPMRIADPFSQIDLRSALCDALAATTDADEPRLHVTDRPVFQYLGDLRRPRQVAYWKDGKRFIYDFRTRRAQRWDGEWEGPDTLAGPDRKTFEDLIHQWEWINRTMRNGSLGEAE